VTVGSCDAKNLGQEEPFPFPFLVDRFNDNFTMIEEDLDIAIKVVIVGNGAVGKSSMIQRYCKGIFTKDYKKTIGVDFLERQVYVDGEDVRLMLWDTAGQEEFDAITKAYYRGAQSCVVAFSLTDRKSFEAVESWLHKVEDEIGDGIPTALVLNKMDLAGTGAEQVTLAEADELANRLRLPLYEVSVKNDKNVNQVFQYLAEKYIEEINGANDFDTSSLPVKDEDPWNRQRSSTTTTATTTTPTPHSAPNDFPREEAKIASIGIGHGSTPIAKLGDDQFMANPTKTPSEQSRPRWRFKRKKKEKNNATNGIGGATIVLAPSKRRTKAKKEFAASCSIL